MQIKPVGRIAIIVAITGLAYYGATLYKKAPKEVAKIADVGRITIPDIPDASLPSTSATKAAFPSTTPALNGGAHFTVAEMAWQAQTAINLANGGERTTKGSFFDKAHLDVEIVRRDDCGQTVAEYVKSVNDYKNGSKDGYVALFMGSGIPNYIAQMTKNTEALGPDYAPIVFGGFGTSYGEDQMIGDIKYKNNPQLLKGAVCVGVMLDGDQDVAMKFAKDNGVDINPNAELYYPDRLNLAYPKDFLDAVVKYNNVDARETRHIVRNGKTTGKDTAVGYDLVATWTPGDVNAKNGRGGATIISTKQYVSIMPCIGIVCKKFANDNRTAIEDFIDGVAQAADQIKSYDDAKKYATKLNAKIWNETSLDWYKLYNGYNSEDMHLGGSGVYNMADMSREFGLGGTSDIYREVYNTFGKIQTALYPKDFPSFIPYNKAVDRSFMVNLAANPRDHVAGNAQTITYSDKPITDKVASRAVHINFETNKATIQESSLPVLNQMLSDAVTSEGLKVGIYGYTDNTGDPNHNQTLSEQRAEAVKNWLLAHGVQTNRLESQGFGQKNPIESNSTSDGKAANRRVEIVLGN